MAEAQAARPGQNTPDGTFLGEMFKSYWRIEDDKNSLRQAHRTKVGQLTAQQTDVKTLVKDKGYSLRAFNELINEEKDRRRVANRQAGLEDDDVDALEAMKNALGAFADTPMGRAAMKAAGASDDDFEQDVRGTDQREREAVRTEAAAPTDREAKRKRKNAALDAVAGNGAEKLATGLKPLHS
ncbi:hypothetical protein MFUR16E_04545 [Methylobacterium fujisawaense]|uniref:hypothetical protein n=1 Tax=Methylobacterium fujisawaense TaxID=107400 RepID=UPI002F3313CF